MVLGRSADAAAVARPRARSKGPRGCGDRRMPEDHVDVFHVEAHLIDLPHELALHGATIGACVEPLFDAIEGEPAVSTLRASTAARVTKSSTAYSPSAS
jgi:hypothetical protein